AGWWRLSRRPGGVDDEWGTARIQDAGRNSIARRRVVAGVVAASFRRGGRSGRCGRRDLRRAVAITAVPLISNLARIHDVDLEAFGAKPRRIVRPLIGGNTQMRSAVWSDARIAPHFIGREAGGREPYPHRADRPIAGVLELDLQ